MIPRQLLLRIFLAVLVVASFWPGAIFAQGAAAIPDPAPPNGPAEAQVDIVSGNVTLRYDGRAIFTGQLWIHTAQQNWMVGDFAAAQAAGASSAAAGGTQNATPVFSFGVMEARGNHDAYEQDFRFRLTRTIPGAELELIGTVTASGEAFAAETLSDAQRRFPLIRTSVGPSRNLRNNAIYDRHWDWVLYGPGDGATQIEPGPGFSAGATENVTGKAEQQDLASASAEASQTSFQMTLHGTAFVLTFKPRYYQKHRNISFYEPWTYRAWPDSVTGWCSWWAYEDKIDQALIHRVADVFAAKLRDYGYSYIQIDDGYQLHAGYPRDWLKTNDKFPAGLADLAAYIRAKNLKPALWLNVEVEDDALAREHPDWFLQRDSAPFKAPWVGYGLDGSNPAMIDALIRPAYGQLRQMGWQYIKVDTLRHLLYDASYPVRGDLERRGSSPEAAFRNVFGAMRESLGRDVYLLACWGVLPETVGIADGARLGTDGFGPATLAQYNSWNNVVWRNDPDHVDIAGEGEDVMRPVLVSMAGAQMLLTDKVEFYEDGSRLEGARRAVPVLFSLPGQLYDFDPTKTDHLVGGLRNATGGTYSGPLDADQWGVECPWWLMDISRPFGRWSVLAHMSGKALPATTVHFADLGLREDRKYLVYEFWSKQFLGAFRGSFPVAAQAPKGTRVFAIREEEDRPQIVSTNRHITQGGVDLVEVRWVAGERRLSGESEVVARDRYAITVRVPAGFVLESAVMGGAAAKVEGNGEIMTVAVVPEKTGRIAWELKFR
jgi:hypothetical protein